DRCVRVPDVDQLASGAAGQVAVALEPGFDLGTLLGGHRTTATQADVTEFVGANEAQAVGLDGLVQKIVHGGVALGIADAVAVVQLHFEAQFLEFVDAEFLAQAARSSHGGNSLKKVAGTLPVLTTPSNRADLR